MLLMHVSGYLPNQHTKTHFSFYTTNLSNIPVFFRSSHLSMDDSMAPSCRENRKWLPR